MTGPRQWGGQSGLNSRLHFCSDLLLSRLRSVATPHYRSLTASRPGGAWLTAALNLKLVERQALEGWRLAIFLERTGLE